MAENNAPLQPGAQFGAGQMPPAAPGNNTPAATATSRSGNAGNPLITIAVVIVILLAIHFLLFFGSVRLYRDAAKNGVPEAQYTYGVHYRYFGQGITHHDFLEAWNWWMRAYNNSLSGPGGRLRKDARMIENAATAENADARAQIAWSLCLANDWHLTKKQRQEEADKLASGDPKLVKEVEQRESKDRTEAENQMKKALESAAKQSPHVQYEIGMVTSGITAFNLFKMAAEKDYADAQYELAKCYQKGEAVDKDEKAAAEWLLKAAKKNCVNAQYELAKCYLNGAGVKKDEKEAEMWMKKAADRGHKDAKAYFEKKKKAKNKKA